MVCKNCGIANSDNSRFCSECGSALPVTKVLEEGEQAPVTENTAPAETTTAQSVREASASSSDSAPGFQAASQPQSAPVEPIAQPFVQAAGTPTVGEPAFAPMNAAAGQIPVQNINSAPAPETNPYNQLPSAPQMPPVAPMPYPPMPMYPYPPMFKDPNGSKVTWALWLGILAAVIPLITCSFGSPLALIMGIVAICLAGANMNKVYEQNKNKAIAALVVGIVGTVFSLTGCSILLRALNTISKGGYLEEFNEYFDSFIAFWVPRIIKISSVAIKAVLNQVQIIIRFLFLK